MSQLNLISAYGFLPPSPENKGSGMIFVERERERERELRSQFYFLAGLIVPKKIYRHRFVFMQCDAFFRV